MSTTTRTLIVEDEADTAAFLKLLIEPRGCRVETASTAAEARSLLASWHPDVVLMDLMLPDANDLELLREFRATAPDVQVLMVTGFGTVARAVEAMNAGALSFIEKPIDAPLLFAQLDKAHENITMAAENRRLREALDGHTRFADLVARSEAMQELFAMIRRVAPTDASVLVSGENGTGKELIATAIHQESKRANGPFVRINCAAIPADLIESELFGHKRGSFTGAVADRVGLLELADGGSLLLDEIGEMPAALQAKLLRVLQDREFKRVGDTRAITSDFRLICATNLNVDEALADRRLREDLYFRINTVTLAVPPLRERSEDIPLLADHFLRKYAARHGRQVKAFHAEAMRALQRHHWPGNVRELEHAVERAVIVAADREILAGDLPETVLQPPAASSPAGDVFIPPHHTLEEIERLAIIKTLERTRGNKRAAASILGVYRPTLYSKMRKYKLMDGTSAARGTRAQSTGQPEPAGCADD